jgi:hypothetical protein
VTDRREQKASIESKQKTERGEIPNARMKRYRARRYELGYKSLTVYVEPKITKLLPYLRWFYQLRGRGYSELIALAIETLYEKTLKERNHSE